MSRAARKTRRGWWCPNLNSDTTRGINRPVAIVRGSILIERSTRNERPGGVPSALGVGSWRVQCTEIKARSRASTSEHVQTLTERFSARHSTRGAFVQYLQRTPQVRQSKYGGTADSGGRFSGNRATRFADDCGLRRPSESRGVVTSE